jgi:hypothetical protein
MGKIGSWKKTSGQRAGLNESALDWNMSLIFRPGEQPRSWQLGVCGNIKTCFIQGDTAAHLKGEFGADVLATL